MRSHLALALCAVSALACSSKSSSTTATTPSTPTERGDSQRYIGGGLSEAEFKALHAPPTSDSQTPRLGTRIELPGTSTKAYLALPQGPGPHPAIVVIHEWWGLNDNIELWTDRLARAGWAAIAVDLYGTVATTRDEAMAAMKAVDPAVASQTIRAALDFAAADPRIQATTTAAIGWCFGGRWSLEAALANPDLDGAIIYYGHLETDPKKLASIKARILGIFGTRDAGIPTKDVEAFEAALKQNGTAVQIEQYDAEHAFANPSNPQYDEANAADAWQHVLAFLQALRAG